MRKVCEIKDTDDTEMMWVYFTDTGFFDVQNLENIPKDQSIYNDILNVLAVLIGFRHNQEEFKEFANILHKISNCNIEYTETPKYTKKVDVGNFVVDNSKLKKLGWNPKISVEEGIKKTMEFFTTNTKK